MLNATRGLALMIGFMWTALAPGAPSNDQSQRFDKLFKKSENRVDRSVHLVRLRDGATLYEKDPDKLLIPASVTKLVTSAALLARFSPVHTFTTRLFHTGTRSNSSIKGDLIVVGDGDPFVISEKLWQMAADLRHRGLREVSGDLIVDNGLFDQVMWDPSRNEGRDSSSHAYDAPVTSFGVNFNTYVVAVAPSERVGTPALVSTDPYPLKEVALKNKISTSRSRISKQLQVERQVGDDGRDRLLATGSIGQDQGLRKLYRSVGHPVQSAGEYLRAFLAGAGIQVRGKVKAGTLPAGAQPLYELESYELSRMIKGLNTYSNNYIADTLLKRVGAAFPKAGPVNGPGQGTFENGIAVITDFLKKEVGVSSDFVLINGSGLSPKNRLSARQITALLSYMESRMDLFPEFLASLPAAGWTGTLKKRFSRGDGARYKGLFRAKTGTLSAPVSAVGLGGYFRHPTHGMVAFCILENGKPGQPQPGIGALRDGQDEFLIEFYKHL